MKLLKWLRQKWTDHCRLREQRCFLRLPESERQRLIAEAHDRALWINWTLRFDQVGREVVPATFENILNFYYDRRNDEAAQVD